MNQELQIGSIAVSVILSILLRMIYGTWEINSRGKPWIAVGLGMGLAVVTMYAAGVECQFRDVTSYLVQGFMTGATATGLYEMTRTSK
jgi:hypothetical protein